MLSAILVVNARQLPPPSNSSSRRVLATDVPIDQRFVLPPFMVGGGGGVNSFSWSKCLSNPSIFINTICLGVQNDHGEKAAPLAPKLSGS